MEYSELQKKLPKYIGKIDVTELERTLTHPDDYAKTIRGFLKKLRTTPILDEGESLEDYYDPEEDLSPGFLLREEARGAMMIQDFTVYKGEHTEDGEPMLDINISIFQLTHSLHMAFDLSSKSPKRIPQAVINREDEATHLDVKSAVTGFIAEKTNDKPLLNASGTSLASCSIRSIGGTLLELTLVFFDDNDSNITVPVIIDAGQALSLSGLLLNRDPNDIIEMLKTTQPVSTDL